VKRCHRIGPYGGLRDSDGRKLVAPQAPAWTNGMTTTAWKEMRPARVERRQKRWNEGKR
jgi:hypothetical protein